MNTHKNRLLIVDDNEMNRDMLARRLARKGYEIGLAENAQQLLKRVEQDGVDLVLLDIEMPEISEVDTRSEEHTSELQSRPHLVCRLLLAKKKKQPTSNS